MSLLNSLHLTIDGHDSTNIFLLTAREFEENYFHNRFTVSHKEKPFTLELGFDYLDKGYVSRGEFKDIHKNSSTNYSRDIDSGWYKHVAIYVADVVRLWILIKELEPTYQNFEINSIKLGDLSDDLSEDNCFVWWVESVVMEGRDIEDIEDVLSEFEEYEKRETTQV